MWASGIIILVPKPHIFSTGPVSTAAPGERITDVLVIDRRVSKRKRFISSRVYVYALKPTR